MSQAITVPMFNDDGSPNVEGMSKIDVLRPLIKAPVQYRSSSSEIPRPFVKFVGGKARLLPELIKRLPASFGRYHESFVGGGALFWHLRREGLIRGCAILADKNERLIRAWRAVRDDVDLVVDILKERADVHRRNGRDLFEFVRSQSPESFNDAGCAAWLIYLNKTAYNGLYRVNTANEFNAPFGDYVNPKILDEPNLRACSRALQGVEIKRALYIDSIQAARPGDLVYLDPPYVPTSKTASFVGYAAGGFDEAEQARLSTCARLLKERGVHVIATNSDVPLVRELYPEPFWRVDRVEARGNALNSDPAKRGRVGEVIIS